MKCSTTGSCSTWEPYLRLDLAIATREPFVLADVFGPGPCQKRFQKHVDVVGDASVKKSG
jgi:hypothetical protein